MKTIVVDDDIKILDRFQSLSKRISQINLIGRYNSPLEALKFAEKERIQLAILDINMPEITGIELAKELRKLYSDVLIVFITAQNKYIREANLLGAGDYILKPFEDEIIENMAKRMYLLSKNQKKDIYIQMFGQFYVMKNGEQVPLSRKVKEILALIVAKRGHEISNKEIYSIVWKGRPYSNIEMKVYYNAMKRLKNVLQKYEMEDLVIFTTRGVMINTDMFDCDYYSWLDSNS